MPRPKGFHARRHARRNGFTGGAAHCNRPLFEIDLDSDRMLLAYKVESGTTRPEKTKMTKNCAFRSDIVLCVDVILCFELSACARGASSSAFLTFTRML